MTEESKRFLNFNGTNINVLAKDGQYWIAVKPICEVLGVDYIRQFKNLKEDIILGRALSVQTTHDSSNRLQEMTCLPERYIYGWLFSINSQSEQLKMYKEECYNALYNYFHGAVTERVSLLRQKSEKERELSLLLKELQESSTYQKIAKLKQEVKGINSPLLLNDQTLLDSQLDLFC